MVLDIGNEQNTKKKKRKNWIEFSYGGLKKSHYY